MLIFDLKYWNHVTSEGLKILEAMLGLDFREDSIILIKVWSHEVKLRRCVES